MKAGLQPYLVSAMGQLSKIQKLAPQVPKAVIAVDATGVLYRDYHPHSGLTALLVHPDGKVGTVTLSGTKFSLANQLGQLSAQADSARASSTGHDNLAELAQEPGRRSARPVWLLRFVDVPWLAIEGSTACSGAAGQADGRDAC